eukprot:Lithocolla_globosa_v1_NODE_255_length_4802_cov_69.795660.p4 type:complete len:166 gc:universal NODE_255_length_4802_cov_69.795660:2535-2038(-)
MDCPFFIHIRPFNIFLRKCKATNVSFPWFHVFETCSTVHVNLGTSSDIKTFHFCFEIFPVRIRGSSTTRMIIFLGFIVFFLFLLLCFLHFLFKVIIPIFVFFNWFGLLSPISISTTNVPLNLQEILTNNVFQIFQKSCFKCSTLQLQNNFVRGQRSQQPQQQVNV